MVLNAVISSRVSAMLVSTPSVSLKAVLPSLSTMLARLGVGPKAALPIEVTVEGSSMLEMGVLANAWLPMLVSPSGKTTVPAILLLVKAVVPIDFTVAGNVRLVRPVL